MACAYPDTESPSLLLRNRKKITKRKRPMFPIPYWNLYTRILTDKARSTNSVVIKTESEAWHCTITPDSKKKLTLFEVIELFKREQSNSKNWITKLETGHVHKTKKVPCNILKNQNEL